MKSSRIPTALLYAFFFFSGATSLTFEVAWSKQLSYILGNTLFSVSTVVAAFMTGLALGSGLASRWAPTVKHPIAAYGAIQLAIAAWGFLSIPIFRATEPLFRTLYQASDPGDPLFLLARFAVVFILMLAPAALMGTTLPLLTGALVRDRERYDLQAGLLYGVNTLGAVVGTWFAGFVLLGALGVWKTTLVAAIADVLVGAACIWLGRAPAQRLGDTPKAAPAPVHRWSARQWTVAALFGLSGAVAMVLELGWFRLLGLTMGPSVYAFSAMLATYLAGIGLGSALAAPWVERRKAPGLRTLLELEGALALVSLGGLFYFNQLPEWNLSLLTRMQASWGVGGISAGQLLIAAVVVMPSCLLSGAVFPAVVRAARELDPVAPAGSTVGRLYLSNTLGAIVGSLVTGFLLVPTLGAWSTLQLGGLMSAAIATGFGWLALGRLGPWLAWPIGAVILAAIAPKQDLVGYNRGLYRQLHGSVAKSAARPREQLIFHREGLECSVAVFRTYGGAALYVSGKPDASTNLGDLQTQLFTGHFPVLFCRNPERVAMVGYGSGMTAAGVLAHPEVKQFDLLEIERAVLDASPYFESINHNPFDDPRTRMLVEDGRAHLTYTSEMYDVIMSEPSNPWMAGVANLFTTDFYHHVKARLRPGGVFAQWIQNYDIDSEIFHVILASLHESFPHLVVMRPNVGDFIVLASLEPIAVPWSELSARFAQPTVSESFRQVGVTRPEELFYFFQGPEEPVLAASRATKFRNTDDNTWLEHRMPFELFDSGPKAENVGVGLSRLGAEDRIRGFQALVPGAPIGDCIQAAVIYPYRLEPLVESGAVFSDPWHETRPILERGLRAELAELQGAAGIPPVAAIDEWANVGGRYLAARTQAANSLISAGEVEGAVAMRTLEQALTLAPDLPYARCLQARALIGIGDLDGAEAVFRDLLPFPGSPAYLEALMGLAQIEHANGRLDEAASWCQLMIERNPYLPTPYLMLADLRRQQGRFAPAREALLSGLRANPNDSELTQMLREFGG